MKLSKIIPLLAGTLLCCIGAAAKTDAVSHVRGMMGTGGDGRVLPMAAYPFGMVQLGPDTHFTGSGYHYDHPEIYGFSHIHKSGGGGCDFQDIMFFPVNGAEWRQRAEYPSKLSSRYSHEGEYTEPGYYTVTLDNGVKAEFTATERCGMHRYSYPDGDDQQLVIDLKHGCQHSTTIYPDEDFDTVFISSIEIVDPYTVRGSRVTNGWAPEQHAYFYAEFSKPIVGSQIFDHRRALPRGVQQFEGTDVRGVFQFGGDPRKPLIARVGISPVSEEGARANLHAEIATWNFDKVRHRTRDEWNETLSVFTIGGADTPQKETFYTCLYFATLYPMLFGDVDGSYRSSDAKVYKGDFKYYAGVLGLWDTFRAQNPLISILRPDIAGDLMKTFLEHYNHCGQLPIWTLAGVENMCMIGIHSMPVIADIYSKGIRGYDVEALYQAMKVSANRDTYGYFLKDFRGSRNYKKYGYVPCDLEITSVSKTLEYCYDDWCIAQMAKMLGYEDDYNYYIERAGWYKHLFDGDIDFMRGKNSDGSWRTPFDPFYSNHYRPDDDFCEGTAWQWTFFVPHDGQGLIDLFGTREAFVAKLDSLFTVSSNLTGEFTAPDITGLIGQYAQGNEPGHHTLYMYDYAGEPWKGQKMLSEVMYTLYDTSPEGICGNDDTGQMSAWYVFSAMGFYPVTHGTGTYFIGTPLFEDLSLKHTHGTLKIRAEGVSRERCYIQSLTLNGKPYDKTWLRHDDLFGRDATLVFTMGDKPNTAWGSSPESAPASMKNEKFTDRR